jgi:alkylhydroperoxidase family enzyme
VPKEKFDALPDYERSDCFSALERLVLRYTEQMTRRVRVDGELVAELTRHFSPEELMQLTLTVAAANFTNRVNEAMATDLE